MIRGKKYLLACLTSTCGEYIHTCRIDCVVNVDTFLLMLMMFLASRLLKPPAFVLIFGIVDSL